MYFCTFFLDMQFRLWHYPSMAEKKKTKRSFLHCEIDSDLLAAARKDARAEGRLVKSWIALAIHARLALRAMAPKEGA